MPILTIYQKPTCSTCRRVMKALGEAGIDYDSINYIIEPPSRQKLGELAKAIGGSPRELLRTKEQEYRDLNLKDSSLSDEQILDAMAEHPALIQRPILEYGKKAALVRPPEKIDEVIADWKLGK